MAFLAPQVRGRRTVKRVQTLIDTSNQQTMRQVRQPEEVEEWLVFGGPSEATALPSPSLLSASDSKFSYLSAPPASGFDEASSWSKLSASDRAPPAASSAGQSIAKIETSLPQMPMHDGLGSFAPSSLPVQTYLYSFERFNPDRGTKPLPELKSISLIPPSADDHRRRRIEAWTRESSQIVLREVARETRRRERRFSTSLPPARQHCEVAEGATQLQSAERQSSPTRSIVGEPSFWTALHDRIQDFFGVDNDVLAAIFGEALIATQEQAQSAQTGAESESESGAQAHRRIEAELRRYLEEQPEPGVMDDADERWMRLCDRIDREMHTLSRHLAQAPTPTPTAQRRQLPKSASQLTIRVTDLPAPGDSATAESPWSPGDPDDSAEYEEEGVRQELLDQAHWSESLGLKSTFRYFKQQLFARSNGASGLLPGRMAGPG